MRAGDLAAAGKAVGKGIVSKTAREPQGVERVMGIEPTLAAWEAAVLPLNYTRVRADTLRCQVAAGNARRVRKSVT